MAWIADRPETYDETLIWDEDAEEWIASNGSGGARLQINLVAIGYDDNGYGVIYYG